MSKIPKKEFLNDVMFEINTLKELATREEIANLDFETFDPNNTRSCIYGQLTGNCQSVRAKELMDKACVRVMDLNNKIDVLDKPFSSIQNYVNGKNEGQGWNDEGGKYVKGFIDLVFEEGSRNFNHISVLEAYIALKDAKNGDLLKYLKGEINSLTL